MAIIKISRENFYHNLNQIALKTGSLDKVAVVLKDNAYGHGLSIMAELASEYGIRHTAVKNTQEAKQIKALFKTVLVLNDKAIKDSVCSYALNSMEDIRDAKPGAKVELKIDTGMHRNGIDPRQLDEALALIEECGLELVGVMTHYRSADELSSEFFWQKKQFEAIRQKVRDAGHANVRFHSHNSAAILRTQQFDENIVRVGIAIYGYSDLPACYRPPELKPVLSLWAKRIAKRELPEGARIGYGGDYQCDEALQVSTYDLGYGDGWMRGNDRESYMTAEGLPILGRVSMDFISLASEKDEVCIMTDAKKAAGHFGTISYEMTTMLSPAIKRVVV